MFLELDKECNDDMSVDILLFLNCGNLGLPIPCDTSQNFISAILVWNVIT